MQSLRQAHDELFRRSPDESFPTLQALWDHCQLQKERSKDRWQLPELVKPRVGREQSPPAGQIFRPGGPSAATILRWSRPRRT